MTLALFLAAGLPAAGGADVCSVPGTHTTIEAAVSTRICTEIDLANQSYQESVMIWRDLTISGPAGGTATIEGLVEIIGIVVRVVLADLTVSNGCPEGALVSVEGAEVEGSRLTVTHQAGLPCPPSVFIYADGFESSDTSGWSMTLP